jgi:hypothetical protein
MSTLIERKHSIFAPSASKRWLNCPGSIKLSEKSPPQKDTPEAIEGTDAHWVLEMSLKKNVPAINFIGVKLPSGNKCPTMMAKNVQKSVDYVNSHMDANGGSIHIEQRFTMEKVDPRWFGSCDVAQLTKSQSLHIFDLKYGLWIVEPEKNTQMMSYALGALTRFKNNVDFTKPITAHIMQPRAQHKHGPNRSAKFTVQELIDFGNKARAAIKASDEINPPLNQGDWCQFCPAEFICPELNKIGRKIFV